MTFVEFLGELGEKMHSFLVRTLEQFELSEFESFCIWSKKSDKTVSMAARTNLKSSFASYRAQCAGAFFNLTKSSKAKATFSNYYDVNQV